MLFGKSNNRNGLRSANDLLSDFKYNTYSFLKYEKIKYKENENYNSINTIQKYHFLHFYPFSSFYAPLAII